ncbi:transporter YjgP/YjgQ [Ameyamaea chiangmaiensis NBRC 103196]|uniref:LPS export ABC transporter permease LptF n=1 Tax=Ameyamaea chiangmaiensis TaxID=442969 RepID=A0A850P8U5_9PROT|nr:LPS export ABC transporter permease LptF [Ameyamaea chiangmaiensis]MBS4074638.1 LPS export ABC transporter permease LptF [Ameyamaea chiangmaiensis]NVN39393.1 LPS export ABC transporter permease LptF [Ameyamaea chiangmaiensis]GBQ64948.1 transporter YjgP/YjgQ [Ameyamaea chiangmaiensis NBRC 103196]
MADIPGTDRWPAAVARLRAACRLTLLDRYTLRQLLLGLVATTGGAAALIWLTQSLRFISLVVERGLSLRVFIELTSLLMPSFIAVILPITTFLVVLFGYQRLSGDRELTVMRAAGLSQFSLARAGLMCALIATATCFLLNLWIVPKSYHSFRKYEFQIRNKMAAFLLQEGVFAQLSPTMTVYVRQRDRDGTLHGILVEDDRTPQSHATILAEHGALVVLNDQPRVILYNGTREEIDRKTGRLNMLSFAQNTMDLASSHGDEQRFRDISEMSLHELFHPTGEMNTNAHGKMAVEGWRRLTAPLTAFSFAMIGLLAILRGVFSRHGSITRPLLAIFAVVGLLAANLMIQNFAGRDLGLVPLIWLVSLAPGLVCAAIMFTDELRDHIAARKLGAAMRPTAEEDAA